MGKVNPQDLNENQIQAAARIIYRSAQKFFDDPENEKKFETWKAQRASAGSISLRRM